MGVNTSLDVSEKDLNNLHQLLTRYLPNTKVWAFGSRVKWTSRPDSDLDLVVFTTKEQSRQVHNLKDALQESSLPFRVDVLVWDNIPDTFRENIQQQYFVLVDLNAKRSWVMSSEWSTLEEVADVIDSLHKTPTYSEFGFPMVRGTDVKYGELNLTQTFNVDKNTFSEFSRRYKPAFNDIIITRVGSYGITARVTKTEFCLGQNTSAIVPTKINPRYLYAALNSSLIWSQIESGVVGSTQKTLSLKVIKALKIPRHGENSEKEIATILGALDDRITLLRETNATLEAIAQALFKSWFVDFDPVHAKQQGRLPEGMDEQTATLFPDSFEESELGLVPLGWEVGTLGDMSKNNSAPFDFSKVDKVVFVNTGDVSNGEFLNQNYSLKEGLPGQAKKAIYEDDILFSEIRPKNGRFAYVNFDAKDYVVSTKFMVLRAINNIPPRYLYQVLRQTETIEYFNVIAESRSGTFPQITFDSVKNYKLIKPSGVCLDKYIECVNPIFHKVDLLNKQAQTLADLRDTLLPRLISGQLRVGDVEEISA